ncbi:thioredoxin family protein [Candidatus Uabimicrobium amorphum]|uniref:Thioredoxin family protein n=1 Tax=Uabimicrobium amorphum TaxID=2596890 RepID=A0A5S9IH84_UABAM|nr:thioredoxin fold domain-containing protein [Candidatus Uabimicrobium amorphum]BBM81748.1 thioredoxin family protein [Candidatus Uabimicrobium amorphum]
MSKTIILLMSLCVAVTCFANEVATEGAEIGKWTMDVDAAYKLAEENKLPILMNFTGSDWCYWCKLMDKNVFADAEWQKYAQKSLVLVTVDFPSNPKIVPEKYKERNKGLAKQFAVRGYPTYILLDSKKKQIAQLGAGKEKTAASFRNEILAAINLSPEGIAKTLAKLENAQKAEYEALIEKRKKIIKDLEAWIMTRPERNEENLAKYNKFISDITAVEEELQKYW